MISINYEKEFIPYATNHFLLEYDFVLPNIKYKGSEADLLCVNERFETIEVEVKFSSFCAKNEFNKTIFENGKKWHERLNKYEQLRRGHRVNRFYFFIHHRYGYMIKYIPKDIGVILFKSYDYNTSDLDTEMIRESSLFKRSKVTLKEYRFFAMNTACLTDLKDIQKSDF